VRPTVAFLRDAVAAVRLLARDGRIPRPLRGLVAVGVLPIPGPVDEAVLLLSAGLLFAFYRGPMREAWERARLAGDAQPPSRTPLAQKRAP
jgi:hypothetical protein